MLMQRHLSTRSRAVPRCRQQAWQERTPPPVGPTRRPGRWTWLLRGGAGCDKLPVTGTPCLPAGGWRSGRSRSGGEVSPRRRELWSCWRHPPGRRGRRGLSLTPRDPSDRVEQTLSSDASRKQVRRPGREARGSRAAGLLRASAGGLGSGAHRAGRDWGTGAPLHRQHSPKCRAGEHTPARPQPPAPQNLCDEAGGRWSVCPGM